MTFAQPIILLHLFWLIPALLIGFAVAAARRERLLTIFGELGVDTEDVLQRLAQIPISIQISHCNHISPVRCRGNYMGGEVLPPVVFIPSNCVIIS